jgi:hypothetical protein
MQEQTRTACFVIPYFGILPDFLDIFLRTCALNPDVDWLIITDDHSVHPYPSNIHIQYSTFDAFRERVQSNFNFHIDLQYPYKICDFRAAFGEIFANELSDYRFWGHCDLDQYFGKIRDFITEDVLASYDKILCLGHFTLFRNCARINAMYKIKDRVYNQGYQDAFSDNRHWIFDEWPLEKHTSSNRIFKQEQVKTWLCPDCFCDLQPFQSCFRRTLFDYQTERWTDDIIRNEVYVWDRGKLYRCYSINRRLQRQEILYVHIRQRKIKLSRYSDLNNMSFCIIPNQIISLVNFSDNVLNHYLTVIKLRSLIFPEEIKRKRVLLIGYIKAIVHRIKKTITHKCKSLKSC